MSTPALVAREADALLPTYRRKPVEFVEGSGAWLVDADGRRYLDFLSGLSVTSLGHAHPEVAAAVDAQMRRLVHTSNLFYTAGQVELAERLRETLGWPAARAFFCNSGAEANEAAIKLARRHGKARHPGKVKVVALEGGFHGRTLATLLATGNPDKHRPFEPLGRWVCHVSFDNAEALEEAVDDETCAVLIEVVQGEGGVRPVPLEVLRAARRACDRVDALLIADEVQTGLGRLGTWYGWQGTGAAEAGGGVEGRVVPDVVTLAKALANGLPIGAIVARGAAATAFGAGDHATTFGGGPVVCAAALTVLEVIERDDLVGRAARMGTLVADRLGELVARHPLAVGVRGRGLLQALVLDAPCAGEVAQAALEGGLVVNDVAADVVRLAPPLIIDEAEVDEMVNRLDAALERASAQTQNGSAEQR